MSGQTQATVIRGARTHNLSGITCRIPLGKLTAITGVSGSGKSTLAFDTLYAEGQRRFVECLSAYARQFLERLDRPDVDFIGHIEPPIALKQKTLVRNARSTVGSLTEINDEKRLLFTHAGATICPSCRVEARETRTETVIEDLAGRPPGEKTVLAAPVEGRFLTPEIRRSLTAKGYVRVLVDGEIRDLSELPSRPTGEVLLVVDRLVTGRLPRSRLRESVDEGWMLGRDRILAVVLPSNGESSSRGLRTEEYRLGLHCPKCNRSFTGLTPAHFSSNSPLGACPECQGFGRSITIDPDKVVPDASRTLRNHAVALFSTPAGAGYYRRLLRAAEEFDVPTDVPWSRLSQAHKEWVWKGGGRYRGVERFVKRLERKKYRMHVRIFLARFRAYVTCPKCKGSRLRTEARHVRVGGKTFHELQDLPIGDLARFFHELKLTGAARKTSQRLLRDIRNRLDYMRRVGLDYLTLGRAARTLSGGETQRIRLAAALGSGLTDTLYVLDEPTVGLHARDAGLMLRALKLLCEQGNTVVVVEHDPAIIRGAEHLIVLGPKGGDEGGRVLYEGPVKTFLKQAPGFFHPLPNGGRKAAPGRGGASLVKESARRGQSPPVSAKGDGGRGAGGRVRSFTRKITMKGLRAHNLQIPKLDLPIDRLTVITGVSGSGKSTLVDHVLHRNYLRHRGRAVEDLGEVDLIEGLDQPEEIHLVHQTPLGRSSRSSPLTFVKVYPEIRQLFAETPAAKARRLKPGQFSFNSPGGRCEMCSGLGTTVLEMHFLPDVEVPCEACGGRRFRSEILEVAWKGKTILDVLEMTVDQAERFFASEPRVLQRLKPLQTVGLGYIRLGQATSTLSGGEAQRLKLASFLAGGPTRRGNLFVLDEPTTGLHPQDVQKLIAALRGLLARGHGVVVVEHQLDLIEAADWVIDLGPGGGDEGGRLVFQGRVDELMRWKASITGRTLSQHKRERSRLHRALPTSTRSAGSKR
jgi:excinuclease ABC subunit A